MSEPLTSRPATDPDSPLFYELFASSRREAFLLSGLPLAQVESLLQLQHRAQRQGHRASYPAAEEAVLCRGGEAVGRLLVDRSGSPWHLVDVAIRPELRGQGLGTAALEALCAQADRAQRPMALMVAADNPAQRLYARLGFVETARDAVYRSMHRAPRPAAGL